MRLLLGADWGYGQGSVEGGGLEEILSLNFPIINLSLG